MEYHKRAEYADGRESSVSGMEADDKYAPHEHLRKVGSRIVMMAPVVHQLVGDEHVWDRIAIAQYRGPHGDDRDVVEQRVPEGRRPQGGGYGLHDPVLTEFVVDERELIHEEFVIGVEVGADALVVGSGAGVEIRYYGLVTPGCPETTIDLVSGEALVSDVVCDIAAGEAVGRSTLTAEGNERVHVNVVAEAAGPDGSLERSAAAFSIPVVAGPSSDRLFVAIGWTVSALLLGTGAWLRKRSSEPQRGL